MKRKRFASLLAVLTAGSLLFLSGCNLDVTNINEEEVPIEVEAEEEDLADGTVLLHSVWYDAEGKNLPHASVTFYEDETISFRGETGEDGSMESFTLPSNTTLLCSVTDENGTTIAETEVVIKLSDNYESLTIYPPRDVETEEEVPTLTLELPTDKVNLRAAFYVTESGTVSIANLTPYIEEEPSAEETEEETEEVIEEQPVEEVLEVVDEAPAEEIAEEVAEEVAEEEHIEEVVEVVEEAPAEETPAEQPAQE